MVFIGRTNELAFLESCYHDENAQLVFLYGRRRVGKTETLSHFTQGKSHVFFAAQSATKDEQLAAFSRQMFEAGAPAGKYIAQYSDWNSALSDIANLPATEEGHRLVVLDEFPYLVKSDPSLPSVLQNLWDHTLRHENVMIVLCGSAMSFIEKELLAEKSPLYGRATGILNMLPMPYWDAVKFLPNYSVEDKILAYATLGGIPHYLAQFNPSESLETNIKQHILRRGSALYSETEFLMHQEFRETAIYNSIIQAIALGATQLSDIANRTMMAPQKASTYIANLLEIGVLEREFPVGTKPVERSKGMRGLYQISDNFFRFWYAFVFSNRSDLEFGDIDGIYRYAIEPQMHAFASKPFEHICAMWLRRENMAERLPFRAGDIGRWWSKRDEIDVIATSKTDERLIVGECKFQNKQLAVSVLRALQNKGTQLHGTQQYYYLFSPNGFTAALERIAQTGVSIRLVTARELFD
ncbi:ATP-binding protein [Bifidobacterium subtile]|jgi:AAA+ ATPase superfamily predicted ATPase